MARQVKGHQQPLDCTSECHLKQHADIITACSSLGNLKLLQHCVTICGNPFHIVDSVGRNVLHVAASKGHLHIVEWLLTKKRVTIDLGDFESRWSALHRSLYFGYLGVAVFLVKVYPQGSSSGRGAWPHGGGCVPSQGIPSGFI